MLNQFAKNNQESWETAQACSIFLLFILRPDIESIFTLIGLSLMLIGLGISPLSIKRDSVSIATASCIMIAFGCAIGGLTIATLLERLFAETPAEIAGSWVANVALICSSLGVLAWIFIVLKISPVSRPPRVVVVLFALAGVYSLLYGILTIGVPLFNEPLIIPKWETGIAYLLNGGAIVGWTLLFTRKTSIARRKILVICLMIIGAVTIIDGITHISDAIW
ncbi:hypothetical protein C6500_08045 [Candidatus Poribacteria bacterium]|nr:MAG: hypothetical protein C6500_08045 [Candidatus Poribacteria bacterium]